MSPCAWSPIHCLSTALSVVAGLVAMEVQALPPLNALQSGAARYETGPLNVSAADEASIYTPAGFAKPGQAKVVDGKDTAHLKIEVRDATTGELVGCRINVVGPDGNYYQPKSNDLALYGLSLSWNDRIEGLPRGNRPGVPPVRYYGRFFYSTGESVVDVPAGAVRVEVSRGFEHRPAVVVTRVDAGESRTVNVTTSRTTPMREYGYYSGDPHLHFPRRTAEEEDVIFDLMSADDIQFGCILAYNHPPGPYSGVMENLETPQLHGMGRNSIASRGDYHIMSGQEYRSGSFGHINFYMNDGLVLPEQTTNADDWPVYGELAAEIQKAGGYAFYAHGGYAQSIYADIVQGNVDGVELLQFAVYRGMGLEDWYHVLNSGFRCPLLGASDYPWCRVLGDCKTYVGIDGDPSFPKWLEGAAGGRSFVTSGPMLLLEAEEASGGSAVKPGGSIKLGRGPHIISVRIKVRSEIAPVTNVQLIRNGQVIEEVVVPADQGVGSWIEVNRSLEIDGSAWIAARAYSKSPSGAANAEAHTNPIYAYVDGKAPYNEASLERVAERVDLQIQFHKQRSFDKKTEVLRYFEKSRDILSKIRANGGASADGHPSEFAPVQITADATRATKSDEELREYLKSQPPKSPSEAQAAIEVQGGFEMQLVASEPLVFDPIAAEFDENGQLYVCEMRDYPYKPKAGDKPLGAVRLLRDSDGDGVFDESHVFADGLLWPSGVAPWQGGVFVAAAPDIWYLKDTDGDHIADVREKVFTGFGADNQQAMLNNLKWGIDHKIYGATAGNGGEVADAVSGASVRVTGRDFRFDAQTRQFETVTGTVQFGNSFDDWGNRFVCNEANPLMHIILPEQYLARNPHLSVSKAIHNIAPGPVPIFRSSPPERWREIRSARRVEFNPSSSNSSGVSHNVVDAAAGVTIYRGDAYPPQYYGNAFVGDSQNNLILRRSLEPDGVSFKSERLDAGTEFVRSSDNWFRPVNFVNAPDGTLFVLDMSREIIESVHIPTDVVKHLDLTNGRDQGRIYRLAPPKFRVSPAPRLGEFTSLQLVAALESPSGWKRDSAHRLIHERQDLTVVSALRGMLTTSRSVQARVLALWLLEGLGSLTDDDIEIAIDDVSPRVREHAVRLAESRLSHSPRLRDSLLSMTDDVDARVCLQLAFTFGEIADSRAIAGVARIVKRFPDDYWIRTAGLSSSGDRAGELFRLLMDDDSFASSRGGTAFLKNLATIIGARNRLTEVDEVLSDIASHRNRDATNRLANSIILGMGGGLSNAGGRLPSAHELSKTSAAFLEEFTQRCHQLALDRNGRVEDRQQAIQVIGLLEYELAQGTLEELLDPLELQSIQSAAIEAFKGFDDSSIVSTILDGWYSYPPIVRTQAIRLLLSRDEWAEAYLAGVEEQRATVAEIDPAGRTQLLQHRRHAIREMAKRLFNDSPRANVVVEYQSALSNAGDPRRGAQIFRRECTACHRLEEVGHKIGPDLASSASQDRNALITNILDPNRYVAPQYLQYNALTDSGRVLAGMIAGETASSISLARGDGIIEDVLRVNIEELTSSGQSLMPEGFEQRISKTEMSDLIAYLRSQSGPSAEPKILDVGTAPGLVEPAR